MTGKIGNECLIIVDLVRCPLVKLSRQWKSGAHYPYVKVHYLEVHNGNTVQMLSDHF